MTKVLLGVFFNYFVCAGPNQRVNEFSSSHGLVCCGK